MKFKIDKKNLYKIKIAGTKAVFTNVNRTYETEDRKEIAILKKAQWVKVDVDVTGETMKLATMTIADLEKEAKRLGVVIEGKITSENKEQVIRKLVEVQGQ